MTLHTCIHPAHRFRTSPASRVKGSRGQRLRTIDLHCQELTAEVERKVAGHPMKNMEAQIRLRTMGQASVEYNAHTMLPESLPALTDLAVRLQDMDAMGVDIQVISPSPNQYYYWAEPELAAQIVRMQNEHIAGLC